MPAASAAIDKSYLQDLIEALSLTSESFYLVCDTSKLTKARKKVMEVSKKNDNLKVSNTDNICIYFDGRKDSTRTIINDLNMQLHPIIIIKEQHITVTIKPGGRYLAFLTRMHLFILISMLKRLLKVFICCCYNIILQSHV